MAIEYVEVLDIENVNVTVANTLTTTTIYTTTIPGGSLGENNSLRWQSQNIISSNNSSSTLTVQTYYGGLTVSSVVVQTSNGTGMASRGLFLEGIISGDGSVNSQVGILRSELGVAYSADASIPVGFGTCGVSSNGDQTFAVKVNWSASGASNSFICYHSTLELVSFVEDTAVSSLDEPTAQILISSKLNKMDWNLRKNVYFYAPLEYDLVFHGYGACTYTRTGTTSTAIWRDGASHAVDTNKPRFEYSGDNTIGIAINTATETLAFDTQNLLSNSNTLIWLENNVLKSTPTNTNIFTGSTYSGSTGVHLKHLIKFSRVLSASEISYVGGLLTS